MGRRTYLPNFICVGIRGIVFLIGISVIIGAGGRGNQVSEEVNVLAKDENQNPYETNQLPDGSQLHLRSFGEHGAVLVVENSTEEARQYFMDISGFSATLSGNSIVDQAILELKDQVLFFEVIDSHFDELEQITVMVYHNSSTVLRTTTVAMDTSFPFILPIFRRSETKGFHLVNKDHSEPDPSDSEYPPWYARDLWFSNNDGDIQPNVPVYMPCSLKPLGYYGTNFIFEHPYTGYRFLMGHTYIPNDSILIDFGVDPTPRVWLNQPIGWVDQSAYPVIGYDPSRVLVRFVDDANFIQHLHFEGQDIVPVPEWEGSDCNPKDNVEWWAYIHCGPRYGTGSTAINIELNNYLLDGWILRPLGVNPWIPLLLLDK